MYLMFFIIQSILYGALGYILARSSIYVNDWQFWVIMLIVTGIRITEFIQQYTDKNH